LFFVVPGSPILPDEDLCAQARLMNELREWTVLRRSTVEQAAIEMIRIGLYQTRERA